MLGRLEATSPRRGSGGPSSFLRYHEDALGSKLFLSRHSTSLCGRGVGNATEVPPWSLSLNDKECYILAAGRTCVDTMPSGSSEVEVRSGGRQDASSPAPPRILPSWVRYLAGMNPMPAGQTGVSAGERSDITVLALTLTFQRRRFPVNSEGSRIPPVSLTKQNYRRSSTFKLTVFLERASNNSSTARRTIDVRWDFEQATERAWEFGLEKSSWS